MKRAFLLAPAALALAPAAHAGPAQATGRAEATVVQSLGGAALSELQFVVPGAAAAARAQATRRARFVVSGEEGRAYAIITPSAVVAAVAQPSGADSAQAASSLRVDRFEVSSGAGTLGANGRATFEISGRLSVPGAAAAAQYRGNINVIVTYL